MRARVITGNKQKIVREISQLESEIREVIVFTDESESRPGVGGDFFAEMDGDTVSVPHVDSSPESIYRDLPGEP